MRRVVILGGGFAGLYAARALKRAPIHVTVIDRTNHHLFQPMLYQVATAALSPSDIAYPIRSVLRKHKNTDVLMGNVTRIDVERRQVHLEDGRSIDYDYLLVAIGAHHSYFGHDEWEQHAPGLKALTDALEVRRRILIAFELAEQERDPRNREALLNFVVIGAGPTGVEVAGAVAEIKEKTLKRDFRNINPRVARVILVEGGDRVLPPYPPKLSAAAQRTLERLGVIVRTGALVTAVRPDGVAIGDEFIPSQCVIWAAGNKASPVLETLGAPLDRQGRVIVEPDLSIPGHPEVLVLGDAAAFNHQPGRPGSLPALSPVAIQMGHYAARIIRHETADNALVEKRVPFSYFDKGQLAVIGRGRAVADLRKVKFSGFFAWLSWIFVHIAYLIGFRNRVIVLTEWAISYFTYGKGARLINRARTPSDGCT
jgi:NADH dehydrogenase